MLPTDHHRQAAAAKSASRRRRDAQVEGALRGLALAISTRRTGAAAARARVLFLLVGPAAR